MFSLTDYLQAFSLVQVLCFMGISGMFGSAELDDGPGDNCILVESSLAFATMGGYGLVGSGCMYGSFYWRTACSVSGDHLAMNINGIFSASTVGIGSPSNVNQSY
ncbi:hypothetical protein D9758_015827 [Tetrapyrgos nigripes]|uniref:Uncharacterized protein n=1 Tax=Tetrapyrgos nigripes TaxID=182062 RepID=A0A8H5CD41_9AGAR|nr:hypothetical protein D9758_016978 [Tetrapyrgos nigripes]KAF5340532.1 hypothetical protein D9758_015827 [Tetrapyrgos nigripes]